MGGGRAGGGDKGGAMVEIGLVKKVPLQRTEGGLANLRGIKEVKSGIGGRDLGIGIRAGC